MRAVGYDFQQVNAGYFRQMNIQEDQVHPVGFQKVQNGGGLPKSSDQLQALHVFDEGFKNALCGWLVFNDYAGSGSHGQSNFMCQSNFISS